MLKLNEPQVRCYVEKNEGLLAARGELLGEVPHLGGGALHALARVARDEGANFDFCSSKTRSCAVLLGKTADGEKYA